MRLRKRASADRLLDAGALGLLLRVRWRLLLRGPSAGRGTDVDLELFGGEHPVLVAIGGIEVLEEGVDVFLQG